MRHDEPFLMKDPDEAAKELESLVHVFGNGVVCDTDSRGYATPDRSRLTDQDRADLKSLYQQAWSGQLTQINGTPIRFVRPFSSLAPAPDARFALAPVPVG